MNAEHVVVVPSTIALLPAYAGLEDPLPELRAAVRSAVGWLVERHPDAVRLLTADPRPEDLARGVEVSAGARVGRHLLDLAGFEGRLPDEARGLLVVANGTARRSEKAPGHLDERSFPYDTAIDEALRAGSPAALRDLDAALGRELWAFDVPVLQALGELEGAFEAEVDHAGDPFGVQYWVVRWRCVS